MRYILAIVLATVGTLLSTALLWWIAGEWSTFSDRWITLAMVLPCLACLGVGGHFQDAPIPRGRLFALAFIACIFSGLAGYLAVVVTSMRWNAEELVGKSFLMLCFQPDLVPSLSKDKSSMAVTPIGEACLGFLVGFLVPLWAGWKKIPKA